MALPPSPVRNVYLSIQGVAFTSGYRQGFDVLCGPNPPTVTGGYAKWAELQRPLSDSLTIFQGRGASALSINVIFGQWDSSNGWYQDDGTGASIEKAIGKLEWMAGSNFHFGPSPAVYIYSHSNQGGDTDLVPPQYAGMPWIISDGVQWGTAYRNRNGFRIWQEATFTVKNYLNLSAPPKPDLNAAGGYFISRAGRDTALLIAGSPSTNSPTVHHQGLARRILADPKNNPCKGTAIKLARRHVYWQIRHKTAVWVPGHQIT